jgi:hypothetical protein
MNSITCPRSARLDCVVTRRIPRFPSIAVLPGRGDCVMLPKGARLVFDASFEAMPGGWRSPARLVEPRRRPTRHERVDVVIATTSTTACELRVVPHSVHATQWSARRLCRWFRLAHGAADALACCLVSPIDAAVAEGPTFRSRVIAEGEMSYGVHS